MADKKELLIGCGKNRTKRVHAADDPDWHNLTTLDNNPTREPDVTWDLKQWPLPFEDNSFDELHAYEVLEHLWPQGDYVHFFGEFEEYWRILKPNGLMFITVPHPNSPWAFGDPSHTRVIPPDTFAFLSQKVYEGEVDQRGGPMSDFRYMWDKDFDIIDLHVDEDSWTTSIILRAIK